MKGSPMNRAVASAGRSRSIRLSLEILVLVAIFALGGFAAPAMAAQLQQVFVTNTSANPVPVSGTVNVGNLPATQQVSGSVNVGNLPATQNVNVTGGSIQATQQVSNVFKATGFHAVDFADGDELNLGASGLNLTAIAIDDGLSEQDSWRLHVLGMPTGVIKVASDSGNFFIALPQPIAAKSISVQCLDADGCFWSIEAVGYAVE